MCIKNKFFHAFLLLSFLVLVSGRAQSATEAKKLTIMVEDAADPWSKMDGTGYANDIVVAAFKEMGVELELQVVPYARCKAMALKGSIVACFSMTWLPEFENFIKMATQPLIVLNADAFENSSKPLPKPSAGKCKFPLGTHVGIVNEYEYPPEVRKLPEEGVQFAKLRSDQQSLQMLSFGRLEGALIITNDHQPKNQKAKEIKLEKKVHFAFNCGHQFGSIGFSLKHPDGLWAYGIYEQGYKRIKDQGLIKKISQKWF